MSWLGAGDRVVATAPVRVADVGGWTDTWFGSPGQVCSLAVGPGVTVEAAIVGLDELDELDAEVGGASAPGPVRMVAPLLGEDYRCGPSSSAGWRVPVPGRQPLLEQAVASVLETAALPPGTGLNLTVDSAVPVGASLGTSASVVVAVLGALDALLAGSGGRPVTEIATGARPSSPHGAEALPSRSPVALAGTRSVGELAAAAHRVETERAGRESGVADQWAAAVGGCGLLRVGPYPAVDHRAVGLHAATVAELSDRMVTVVLDPHDSSAVHAEVIDAMARCRGDDHHRISRVLARLSALAGDAALALAAGDVDRWAALLVASTDAQQQLHPALVGPAHRAAIEVGRSHGSVGWKVNGAGGDGGSLTAVAANEPGAAAALADALASIDERWQVLDLHLATGLTVT